jgi:hypothetical protein
MARNKDLLLLNGSVYPKEKMYFLKIKTIIVFFCFPGFMRKLDELHHQKQPPNNID